MDRYSELKVGLVGVLLYFEEGIGNGHQGVHCILPRTQPYKQQYRRKQVLKRWIPIMDESGKPWTFHTLLENEMLEQDTTTYDAA